MFYQDSIFSIIGLIGLFISNLVISIFTTALVALALAWPLQLLWNWLMPQIFSLPTITFWQALGIEAICLVLFNIKITFSTSRKQVS